MTVPYMDGTPIKTNKPSRQPGSAKDGRRRRKPPSLLPTRTPVVHVSL